MLYHHKEGLQLSHVDEFSKNLLCIFWCICKGMGVVSFYQRMDMMSLKFIQRRIQVCSNFLPWIHHKIVALLSCDTVTVQVYDQVLSINFLTWENAVKFIPMNSAVVDEPHSPTNAWCMHDKNGEYMSWKWLLWIFKILIAAFTPLGAIFYQ